MRPRVACARFVARSPNVEQTRQFIAGCVIIDRDLFAIPPEEINDAKVLLFPVGRWIIYAGRGTD